MNIQLHIERLVLDGLPLGPGGGARVQAAVEAELARLLSEGGVADGWLAGGVMPEVRAAPIQLSVGARPAEIGGQIASSVYRSIGAKS
jgi:hypothetical protein